MTSFEIGINLVLFSKGGKKECFAFYVVQLCSRIKICLRVPLQIQRNTESAL